jgi:NitT/TauT family transport system substrate-binding protein
MPSMQTRRRFLTTLSLAGAAGLVRPPLASAAEGALETTTVRIAKLGAACLAPQYVAEELLRAEGFTDIRYVDTPLAAIGETIGRGEVDFSTCLCDGPDPGD